jgi:hypothetical protein
MKRIFLIICFTILQLALALGLGYMAINSAYAGKVAPGLSYDGEYYSGMEFDRAGDTLQAYIAHKARSENAKIAFRDIEFVFSYSEIDLASDRDGIISEMRDKSSQFYGYELFSAFIRKYDIPITPKMTLNADKLRSKLAMIADIIDKPPRNANVEVVGKRVVKTSAEEGVRMDVDASFDRLSEGFAYSPFDTYTLSGNAARGGVQGVGAGAPAWDVGSVQPDVTDDMLADIDELLAEASTPILEGCDVGLLDRAADAVEKVWIPKSGFASEPFSLNRYLADRELVREEYVEEYNQLVSTLFIALLKAGIDISAIDRRSLPTETAYCDAGFGTIVYGLGTDFRFTNSLKSNIVIFSSVEGGELCVRIAGSKDPDYPAPREVYSRQVGSGSEIYRDGELLAVVR